MGRLTIDKANSNFSCFVYSLIALKAHGGKMNRSDFVSDVASFCQIPAEKADGSENRTAYNKANFTRYYGLIDIAYESGGEVELLTRRGEEFLQCVEENPNYSTHKDRYRLSENRKRAAIGLIVDSLLFDSFGSFNLGAKKSESPIEPPKVLFRLLSDLGSISDDELCFVLFGMNDGTLSNYARAISIVKRNRASHHSYYDDLVAKGLENIAGDLKLAELFSDPNFGVLEKTTESDSGRSVSSYSLSKDFPKELRILFHSLVPTYQPLRRVVHTNGTSDQQTSWIRGVMLGSVANEERLFYCDKQNATVELDAAVECARRNPKDRVFAVLKSDSEQSFQSELKAYSYAASDTDFIDIANLQIIGDIS